MNNSTDNNDNNASIESNASVVICDKDGIRTLTSPEDDILIDLKKKLEDFLNDYMENHYDKDLTLSKLAMIRNMKGKK